MRRAGWVAGLVLVAITSSDATADDEKRRRPIPISGTITQTMWLYDDAELVGDVDCQVVGAPCLAFGAPQITLKLNGFTVAGRAAPPADCVPPAAFVTTPEDGISIIDQTRATVLGPGRVQRFSRQGIIAQRSSRVTVRRVTTVENCYSGIWATTVTDSEFSENVSARNAIGSGVFPCGGI